MEQEHVLSLLDEAIEMAWAGEAEAALSMTNAAYGRVPDRVLQAVNLMCVTAARTVRHSPKDEYVYVLREGGFVKIGRSINPAQRVLAYNVHSPRPMEVIACLPPSVANEADLHKRFSAYRERGEWFRIEGDLAAWLSEIRRAPETSAA